MSKLQNAKLLAQKPICWVNRNTYLVPSQTYEKKYVVRNEGFRWVCTCPDNQYRKGVCKHITAAKIWLGKQQEPEPRVKELQIEAKCPFCQSYSFVKDGVRNTIFRQKQRYRCKDCKGRFTEGMIKSIKGDEKRLLMAMHLFYSGYSLRKIKDFFSQFFGLEIDHATLYRWVMKFQKIMMYHVNRIYPDLSPTWHADEQEIKVKGKYVYCWNLIDKETRFLIATCVTKGRYIKDARMLFRKSREISKGKPQFIVTDGLQAYKKAIRKEFHSHRIPKLTHIGNAGISKKVNNNPIERYHNTFRERDKVMRGFKGMKSARRFTEGFRLYNNFIRTNMALGGLTPAQAAGIELGFSRNRWQELLYKSMNGDDRQQKRKLKRLLGYTLKIWDSNGKEICKFKKKQFRTDFTDLEKAKEFLHFYEQTNPELVFFAEKRYEN